MIASQSGSDEQNIQPPTPAPPRASGSAHAQRDDVLAPEPIVEPGFSYHRFRQPASSSQPLSPRTSVLGLDRLAQDKRSASASDRPLPSKKARLDDGDKPIFKSMSTDGFLSTSSFLSGYVTVPALPVAHTLYSRQRGDETPSHPGGLSEAGRNKLAEYRRNREKQKGQLLYFLSPLKALRLTLFA
jgi:pre-mRNA-splicing factor ATP-dependent RNA helicase DHX38/PRP16